MTIHQGDALEPESIRGVFSPVPKHEVLWSGVVPISGLARHPIPGPTEGEAMSEPMRSAKSREEARLYRTRAVLCRRMADKCDIVVAAELFAYGEDEDVGRDAKITATNLRAYALHLESQADKLMKEEPIILTEAECHELEDRLRTGPSLPIVTERRMLETIQTLRSSLKAIIDAAHRLAVSVKDIKTDDGTVEGQMIWEARWHLLQVIKERS